MVLGRREPWFTQVHVEFSSYERTCKAISWDTDTALLLEDVMNVEPGGIL